MLRNPLILFGTGAGIIPLWDDPQPDRRPRRTGRLGLWPVLVALREWGDRYLADPGGPPLRTVRRGCEAEVHAGLHCAAAHRVAAHRDVVPRPGPGARRRD